MGDRILFLDVDGVLNHLACWTEMKMGATPVDPECVARLDRIVEATGAMIVLSSSWRGPGGLEEVLEEAGALKHRHPTDWRTPRLHGEDYRGRGSEIADWLSRHPEVSIYAIVDDDSDMLPEQKKFFVQTDFHTGGLRDEHVERLIGILSADGRKAA